MTSSVSRDLRVIGHSHKLAKKEDAHWAHGMLLRDLTTDCPQDEMCKPLIFTLDVVM